MKFCIRSLGLIAIAALLLSGKVARAENEGQDDLDQATEKKLAAESISDLSQVIDLCESAMEKGLDTTNKQFAKNLLTGALMQRAGVSIRQIEAHNRGWQQQRLNAIADLEKAIKNDEKLVPAYLMLAQLQVMADRPAALKSVQQAVDLSKDQPEQLKMALRALARLTEDNAKGIELLEQAKKIGPGDADILRDLALRLSQTDKLDDALANIDAAVKVDPENVTGYLLRGQILLQLKRDKDALDAFSQAVKVDPDSPTVYLIRAKVLVQLKRTDEALADLDHVLESNPEDLNALLLRAQLQMDKGNFDAASNDVNAALKARPNLIDAVQLHGLLAAQTKDYQKAIDDFEKLRKVAPKNPQLLAQLGWLYGLDKRPRKAIEMYSDSLAANPDNFMALRGRADCYLNIGKHAESIPDYEAALKLKPDDSGVMNNLAWVLATSPDDKVRDAKRSLTLGEQAAKATDYKEATILSTLAACYAESGDFAKAREMSQKAVDLGSNDPETAEQLKKELASYKAEKPWREKQEMEENSDDDKSSKDSASTHVDPPVPDPDSAASKDASTRKE